MLIVGRAIAGAGGAGLYSGGMTILGYSIPLNQRAIYLAAFASMFGISSIVGPILGGTFTDKLTWRWCFWYESLEMLANHGSDFYRINLPFGGAAIAIVAIFFKSPDRDFSHIPMKQKIREMDLPGAFFLISAITCLLLALSWGGVKYQWKNSKVWGCLLGFGLLIIIFIVIQARKGEHATIPVGILKQRTMLASALTLAFLSMALFTYIFLCH
jgi:MFS family permease